MKITLKSTLFIFSYIIICFGLLVFAEFQSTQQPIGLILVAMVMSPFIISICGGLPIDCLRLGGSVNQDKKVDD